jgi:hypothetical protein
MPVRCLGFTTTYRRPHMALCCLLQMRAQTFPLHHVIRVASDSPDFDYAALLKRWAPPQTRIVAGANTSQHANYLSAIKTEPGFDRFDLYVKIDDDDFYDPDYVLNVVDDWKTRRWNVSTATSDGSVNGARLRTGVLHTLGAIPEEGETPRFAMTGTLVFDRTALDCLLALEPGNEFEDKTWRRAWLDAKLNIATRARSNYTYHVHGANVSTAHWLDQG